VHLDAGLDPAYSDYWEAFQTLSSSRTSGFGMMNPISLQEIAAYLQIYDIVDEDDRVLYMQIVRGVDSHYLKRESERMKKESEKRKNDRRHGKTKH